MHRPSIRAFAALALLLTPFMGAPLRAQAPSSILAGVGSPPDPKVPLRFDRYYDVEGIGEIGRKLQAAYPDRVHLSSIGKSSGGREMWLLTVTDFKTGNVDRKPGMYIDGNIHGNEIQGAEIAMYTAWWLAEMMHVNPRVDSLMKDRVFYIVPTINPDGRDNFMHNGHNPSSSRSGTAPRLRRREGGLTGETRTIDLNGDGHITQMRKRNPNGKWRTSPDDPRVIIPIKPGEMGEWDNLGYESIACDTLSPCPEEDPESTYDPNRNWPWRWSPQYIQGGADYFPTSLVETRNVMSFVRAHSNIAGAQSYHNSGGMILRGPGAPQDEARPADVAQYDALGKVGEMMLPGYKYMIVWRDLYTVYGGELDWLYSNRGILTFSNEIWTSYEYFNDREPKGSSEGVDARFNRLMLLNDAFVPWTKARHPQYGDIEVGGMKKQYGRAVPGFLLPVEAHRNMAFTLYQAWEMAKVQIDTMYTKPLEGDMTEITVNVSNARLLSTRTQQDVEHRLTRPDWITLEGGDVLAGFTVQDAFRNAVTEQRKNPKRMEIACIGGHQTVTVRWIVRGRGPFTVTVDSFKGGVVSKKVP